MRLIQEYMKCIVSDTKFLRYNSMISFSMLSPFKRSRYLSPIDVSRITLQHMPPSWDADEDASGENWDYLRTVTAVTISVVFNFL